MNSASHRGRPSSIPLDNGAWKDLQSKIQAKIPSSLDHFSDDVDDALASLEQRFALVPAQ